MADKKALPPKIAAMQARKKRRLDEASAVENKTPRPARRRKIDISKSANWVRSSTIDVGDDAEGLHGFLEEISDYEYDNGAFYQWEDGSSVHKSNGKDGKSHESQTGNTDESDEYEDVFEGFDDEPVQPKSSKPESKKKAPAGKKADSKKKAKGASNGATDAKASVANGSFSQLLEETETESVDVSAWRGLELSPDTMAALSALKFSKPTAIQKAVIPEILAGHDVIGKASTGSGKTLAFGIPILERFIEDQLERGKTNTKKEPLALILSPTRELAHQLTKHLSALFAGLIEQKPVIATLTGGLSLQKQQRLLSGADIIVGTPGRIWDVLGQDKKVASSLRRLAFLVIDEADRLLGDGHFKEVEEILNTLDKVDTNDEQDDNDGADGDEEQEDAAKMQRQTLVFSATFDRDLQKKLAGKRGHSDSSLLSNKQSMEYLLSKLNFREEVPKFIDVNPVTPLAAGLKEGLIECSGTEKDLYLYALLLLYPTSRTMVFTNSVSAVQRITPLLQNLNINAIPLSSHMKQEKRLRSIERLIANATNDKNPNAASPASKSTVLVATDVAARGLDIPNVELVIHYHLPRTADTYVHRSGRTARAGQTGSSILICGPEEVAGVRKLIAKVHAHSAISRLTSASDAAKQGFYIRTLDIDRRVVARLKPRATLAKKLADATLAKQKTSKEDDFMRKAAEELGVDYDSEEFEREGAGGRRGRGAGRKKKEREAKGLTKAEIASWKAELNAMLQQRVNVGVSERYLASGRVNVDELLRQQDAGNGKTGEFLGTVNNLGLEDL